jgi:hypothetical protein
MCDKRLLFRTAALLKRPKREPRNPAYGHPRYDRWVLRSPSRPSSPFAVALGLLLLGALDACAAIAGLSAYENGAGVAEGGASTEGATRVQEDADDGTDANGTDANETTRVSDEASAETSDAVSTETSDAASTDGGAPCPSSAPTACGSACVDITSDSNNCGGCGSAHACSGGATCQGGTCKVPGSDGGCTELALPPSVNVDATQWTASFKTSPTWNCNAAGTTTIDSAAGTVTSTSCTLGAIDVSNAVSQSVAGGPKVMVVRLRGLSVTNNHVIHLQGDKPIVFLVSGNVLVDLGGIIDAGATGTSAGPGGSVAGACGSSTGQAGSSGLNGHGGGGGGFGTAGGAGGSNSGAAGVVSASSNLQPLRGGCSGGAADPAGGAGGGAFEISASGTITIGTGAQSAILSAAGGGSPGTSGMLNRGSGGGGSGGGILLVAPASPTFGSGGAVRVHGGASGGASQTTSAGKDGHSADDTRAAGGTTSDGCGSAGASGGLCSGTNCATTSQSGTSGGTGCGNANAGGGGGGGRVQAITAAAMMVCD